MIDVRPARFSIFFSDYLSPPARMKMGRLESLPLKLVPTQGAVYQRAAYGD